MLLAIDVGNTNIVFALFEGDSLVRTLRMETRPEGYHLFLQSKGIDLGAIHAAVISSVVPAVDMPLKLFCENELGVKTLLVSKDDVDITLDFDNPDEVGADRLINALAVKRFYKAPAIVIDFGTATTFDVIDPEMHYIGGVIAPGINLSIEALERAAAKLPMIELDRPEKIIGRSTVQAMQSGVFYGYVAMIEGMVARITAELGGEKAPYVLATGGLAPLFAGCTDVINCVDKELMLKGLLEIYKDAQSKSL